MRTDDECMVSLAGGDEMAFCELVEKYQGPLIGYFNRNLRDYQLGEDLAQEVLLKVHANAGDYRPQGIFKSWMYRLARNLLIDQTRKRKNDPIVKSVRSRDRDDDRCEILDRIAGESSSPYSVAENEAISLVTREVERLSKTSDDVVNQLSVLLDFADGDSFPEIAERRGIPLPTAKSMKRLACEKLQSLVMA